MYVCVRERATECVCEREKDRARKRERERERAVPVIAGRHGSVGAAESSRQLRDPELGIHLPAAVLKFNAGLSLSMKKRSDSV